MFGRIREEKKIVQELKVLAEGQLRALEEEKWRLRQSMTQLRSSFDDKVMSIFGPVDKEDQ